MAGVRGPQVVHEPQVGKRCYRLLLVALTVVTLFSVFLLSLSLESHPFFPGPPTIVLKREFLVPSQYVAQPASLSATDYSYIFFLLSSAVGLYVHLSWVASSWLSETISMYSDMYKIMSCNCCIVCFQRTGWEASRSATQVRSRVESKETSVNGQWRACMATEPERGWFHAWRLSNVPQSAANDPRGGPQRRARTSTATQIDGGALAPNHTIRWWHRQAPSLQGFAVDRWSETQAASNVRQCGS